MDYSQTADKISVPLCLLASFSEVLSPWQGWLKSPRSSFWVVYNMLWDLFIYLFLLWWWEWWILLMLKVSIKEDTDSDSLNSSHSDFCRYVYIYFNSARETNFVVPLCLHIPFKCLNMIAERRMYILLCPHQIFGCFWALQMNASQAWQSWSSVPRRGSMETWYMGKALRVIIQIQEKYNSCKDKTEN